MESVILSLSLILKTLNENLNLTLKPVNNIYPMSYYYIEYLKSFPYAYP